MSLLEKSLVDVAADIATGKVSSVELTRAALARAHALQPRLNCFIEIREERALAAAKAADAALARGEIIGALHGVPLAHKDMYYEAGEPTHCGSRVRRGYVPQSTSTLLGRLSAAGAVTIGTLNMAEFALGATGHNAIWGDCRNPWNTAHITGGSSSGSGAAVAARIAYGTLGSDTGGSVRLPAAATGLVGLKPTYSRLSRAAVMGLSPSIDVPGPLARTAADCARLTEIIAGYDPADPTSSRRAVPGYESAARAGLRGDRVGLPRQYFMNHVTPDVREALERALDVLADLGARIVEVDVPGVEHLTELSRVIVYSEAAALHAHDLRTRAQDYSPQVRIRASTGLAIPAAAYLEALHVRPRLLRAFVETVYAQCDVLFTPTLSIPVPTIEATGVAGGASMWEVLAQLVHCTAPFNYLGLPGLSVPAGFTADELPASFQLVGRPFSEARLFRIAGAYQDATAWHERVPPIVAEIGAAASI